MKVSRRHRSMNTRRGFDVVVAATPTVPACAVSSSSCTRARPGGGAPYDRSSTTSARREGRSRATVFTVAGCGAAHRPHVDLPKPNCASRPSDCADIDVLNTLDGFNVQPRISIPFTGAIDLASVDEREHLPRPAAGRRGHRDQPGRVGAARRTRCTSSPTSCSTSTRATRWSSRDGSATPPASRSTTSALPRTTSTSGRRRTRHEGVPQGAARRAGCAPAARDRTHRRREPLHDPEHHGALEKIRSQIKAATPAPATSARAGR